MFQFQFGAIKRQLKRTQIACFSLFQFQYGAIKSLRNSFLDSKIELSFNSNMVRLKGAGIEPAKKEPTGFQFQYGAIKSFASPVLQALVDVCFNSNMVRLKGVEENRSSGIENEFQFQYGAIKRKPRLIIKPDYYMFQFQYGAIKSRTLFCPLKISLVVSIPIWCD